MSHADPGPLAAYNSLMDPHLSGYFSVPKRKKHLRRAGLITKKGEIVSETTYRLNMAKKEHKKHVRDLLAQAIVHKTLDIERARQVKIKKKLEEIAKIELVRRVRADRGRKGDEDVLPYISPRASSRKGRPASGQSDKSDGSRRPHSAPSRRSPSPSKSRQRDANGITTIYVDEDGYPVDTPQGTERKSRYPNGEIDSRHLYALDQKALQEYTLTIDAQDRGEGPSPYTYSQVPTPPRGSPRSPSARRSRKTKPQSKEADQEKPNMGSLMLHRLEPAVKYQERVQSFCEVTMHYFGSNLNLDYEKFDPRDEIAVEQQHCGGNTLIVFREKIHPGSDFTFVSRRHRGYPFSLTLYVNGVLDSRVSACCEYKHRKGMRLGGKQGHFGLVCVDGAAPCYKCQIESNQEEKKKKKKRKAKKEDVEVPVQEEEKQEPEEVVDVHGEGGEEDARDEGEDVRVPLSLSKSCADDDDDQHSGSSSARSSSGSSSDSSSDSETDNGDNYENDFEDDDAKTPRETEEMTPRSPEPLSDEEIKKDDYADDFEDDDNGGDENNRSQEPESVKPLNKDDDDTKVAGYVDSDDEDLSKYEGDPNKDPSKNMNNEDTDYAKIKIKGDTDGTSSYAEENLNDINGNEGFPSDDEGQNDSHNKAGYMKPYSSSHDNDDNMHGSDGSKLVNGTDGPHNKSADSSGANTSDNTTLDMVSQEMKKVLDDDHSKSTSDATKNGASPRSVVEESDSSSSSSSSSSSESEDETPRRQSPEPVATSSTGPELTVTESSDQAGGHDPDNVAGDETPRPIRLGTLGVKQGKEHEGKLAPLLECKKDIDLTSIPLTEEQVRELGMLIAQKKDIDLVVLRNTGIDDSGIQVLADSLMDSHANPQMLNLNCNKISGSGVKYLLDILRSKPDMPLLLLHANPLGDQGVKDLVDGIEKLYEERRANPDDSLESAEARQIQERAKGIVDQVIKDAMNSDSFRESHGDSVTSPPQNLVQTTPRPGFGLRELDIGDSRITDAGAAHVAKLISLNTPIDTLSLVACPNVTSHGWQQIADALQSNTNLKTLSLDYCQLGDDGVEIIAKALEGNSSITTLDLEANDITDEGARKILELVNLNTVLKDVTLMPGNKISDELHNKIKTTLSQEMSVPSEYL